MSATRTAPTQSGYIELCNTVRDLERRHQQAREEADAVLDGYLVEGVNITEDREAFQAVDRAYNAADEIEEQLTEARQRRDTAGGRVGTPVRLDSTGRHRPTTHDGDPARAWAATTADIMRQTFQAGLTSGSIDVPTLVDPRVVADPYNPSRLVDFLVDREEITSNSFDYMRQTVRTNAAAPVADDALKPTSTFTVELVEDRARVVAHLSEPVPVRIFNDVPVLERFLADEMANGVLDGLENQIVNGDGTGENFTGILNITGTNAIVRDATGGESVFDATRRARTTADNLHESPTGWVFHPDDLETFDLTKDSNGNYVVTGDLRNIFGDLPILGSTVLPSGTGLLADWRLARLYVREGVRIDVDMGGDLFDRNQAKLRGEGRFGIAFTRPQAWTTIDLVGT